MFAVAFWVMPVVQSFACLGIFVLSIGFLSSLKRHPERKSSGRDLSQLLLGVFGLLYIAANVIWYDFGTMLHSRAAAITVFVGIRLLGCISFAMLIPIAFPRSVKVLLPISAALCVVLNILAVCFETRYRAKVLLSADGIGLFVGALLVWLFSHVESPTDQPPKLHDDASAAA